MCKKIQHFVQLVSEASNLTDLVVAAGLDPLEDFVNADLSGLSLAGVDLSGYDLSGANLALLPLDRKKLRNPFGFWISTIWS